MAAVLGATEATAADRTWVNTGNGTAWLTGSNWSGGLSPTTGDIATFRNLGSANTAGVNYNTLLGALSLQSIVVDSSRTRALTVGNSSSARAGTLTLTGGEINAVSNVVLRNASGNLLTLQDNESGSGKVMGISLGNTTENVILLDAAGGITTSSTITGANRRLTLAGSGTATLLLSASNTYSGTNTLNNATSVWKLGHANALGANGNALVMTTGTLDLASFSPTIGSLSGAGGRITNSTASTTATVTSTSAVTGTFAGVIANGSGTTAFTKQGVGTLVFTAANTYTGLTTISAGTLKAGNSSAFGTGPVTLSAGATLDLNSLSLANSITNNGGTLANAGSFSGTSSVSGTADYSGAVGGTVVVDDGGVANFNDSINSLNVSAGGKANLNNGSSLIQATLTNNGLLVANRSSDATLSTAISGSGAFQKLGSGILTVTGNSTYSGVTTVSAGKLKVNGSLGSGGLSVAASAWLMGTGTINGPVTVSGTFAPGSSPGVITLGSLVLTSTSTTIIEVLGTTRGTSYDGIDIATTSGLTYGGLLSFEFGGSALPEGTYDIFNFAGTSSGSLASLDSTGFYAGTWTDNSNGNYTLVKDAQTLTFSQSTGDIIVVPEPATLALAAAGAAALACALRRRR